jgi:hypothetical protein
MAEHGQSSGKIYFFADRISDGLVTLIPGDARDGSVTVPASALPYGIREGDWLKASFEIDREKRAELMRDIDNLMEELGK